ncbi:unnamed protein product [Brachionus calyciflorus]|uniref:Galactosylgalactosylxylosylprotein 3-beta-glucuronosyltransferase n=1 Tax=Brachionus calyciflorus TaxID=104777 RepID=A0A814GKR5_9BILA|nr:unnamed protein product [Brachionus calyciflorus]
MKIKRTFQRKNFIIVVLIVLSVYLIINEILKYENELKTHRKLRKIVKRKDFIDKISKDLYSVKYSLSYLNQNYDHLPTIYVVTKCNLETLTELADLNRLKNTLRLVPKLVWILVEKSETKSIKLKNFLQDSGIRTIHLNDNSSNDLNLLNKALFWLRSIYDEIDRNGVVYFANTSSSLDLKIFEEIRWTKTVSVWPVAFSRDYIYQKPNCSDGMVMSWSCGELCQENDLIDLLGFCINIKLLAERKNVQFRSFRYLDFVKNLVELNEIEPKADMCTKVYVWSTKTNPAILRYNLSSKKSYDLNIIEQI